MLSQTRVEEILSFLLEHPDYALYAVSEVPGKPRTQSYAGPSQSLSMPNQSAVCSSSLGNCI